ncbi:hypothetical protein EU805_06000 [Salipiger sp. IMCC34102]|uniref:DUF5333 domain-containing protein n=1 Tax=Salipiger sp. IMCC34102 TaxID=2510647 RepID=UPI00101D8340|nr:DUF5333 domain-containing protein [Salipiger sp. IMCC34102]RYH03273.1 hypothetical protein EU805_06000 [Salipiger sp. IMCC34102]
MRTFAIAAIMATATTTASAQLRDETAITEGLIAVGMAYEISEQCDSISARTLTGIATLFGLKNQARSLGYSSAEVDAFVDNDAEKDRLEAIAWTRLERLGVDRADRESFCRVGRARIAQGDAVGRLLR